MTINFRFIGLFFLLLIAVASFAHAADKTVDSEARKYVLKGESASYLILANITGGKTYYVVQIDEKNSFVFDEKINPVLDESILLEVLKEYYKQSGATGFTENSKTELLSKFNQSDALFNACHYEFYEFVETNFFWAQFRCVDASTGKVCDAAFAQRKRWKDAWEIYREKIQLLKTAASKSETVSALEQIETAAKKAKNETLFMDTPGGFEYFLGKPMSEENKCLFQYGLVDDVIALSAPAMRNKITDINTEAKELINIYNSRKDVVKVKELQSEGATVLQKAVNATDFIRIKFGPTDQKFKEIEASYEKLRSATTLELASKNFNDMKTKYDELQSIINNPEGLLSTYNRTFTNINAAEIAIEASKKKYGNNDDRVIKMSNERIELSNQLGAIDKRMANNSVVTAKEIKEIGDKAENLKNRALGLPSKQNELDLSVIAAIVVIVVAIIGVILMKKRKSGGNHKEVSIKDVMGSGTEKRQLEREKVDESQNRKAMFPKL
ncbi:hypothetical protein HY989_00730 [Candidatus Micrarchaeota archaeon]|nr:hypothetical protein [Candidatus Micrarchaeota archaeon]